MDTRIDEIADGLFRLDLRTAGRAAGRIHVQPVPGARRRNRRCSTPNAAAVPGGGAALRKVLDPTALRWVSYGHFESDECGALNDWFALAPAATAAQGRSASAYRSRTSRCGHRALDAGETLDLPRQARALHRDAAMRRTAGMPR